MGAESFAVNLNNPGDFFACLGLLHCADVCYRDATGYFRNGRFVLEASHDGNLLDGIVQKINSAADNPLVVDSEDDRAAPLLLHGIHLRLDFWNHIDNRPTIKLFAGQERSKNVVRRWLDHLQKYDGTDDLRGFAVTDLPSGLDATASWNALDVGFSLNEHQIKLKTYPLIEFFAYVGVQTYGWRRIDVAKRGESQNRVVYGYSVWQDPLPMTVARAVAAGALEVPNMIRINFEAKKNGQKQILMMGKRAEL